MNRLWVRLTLAFVVVTLMAVVAIAWLADSSANNEFRQYLARQDVLTQSGLLDDLGAFYQQKGNWIGVGEIISNFDAPLGRGRGQGGGRNRPPILLADAQGNVVYDERNLRLGTTLGSAERDLAQLVKLNGNVVGYLVLGQAGRSSLSAVEQSFLDQLRVTLTIAGGIAILLGVVLGLLISRTIAAPLSSVAQAARKFASHDWSQRVKVQGADEIADVAREFNEMADELERAEIQRRNLMADIAHELRTPLTVLQGNLSAMLDGIYPLERAEIATLYDETRLLKRLVDDLRELALADAGQLQLNPQTVDIAKTLRDAVTNFSIAADTEQVHLDIQTPEVLMGVADPERLAQVIRNLMANALRHTPPNGSIHLSAQVEDKLIRVSVSDTGEGIAPEDLARVFERFYRSDKSRARASGGTGLGLAITKAWVETMGGQIQVSSELGRGSCFSFTVPRWV
ncbi:MAG: HAMP domain-containing protein [Chloroflexi bacterium]|nr:HAMP domain-containing protein [Chloroflexota bacterium]